MVSPIRKLLTIGLTAACLIAAPQAGFAQEEEEAPQARTSTVDALLIINRLPSVSETPTKPNLRLQTRTPNYRKTTAPKSGAEWSRVTNKAGGPKAGASPMDLKRGLD